MQKKFGSMVAVIVWLALVASPVLAAREYWIAADEVQWDYAPAFPINPMSLDDECITVTSMIISMPA